MASSEVVDSGKVSGGRTNFSQTCSLLSQYLKVKGSFGELSLGLIQNSETKGAPTGTMNLLPMIEKSGQISGLGSPNMPRNMFAQPTAGRYDTVKKSDVFSGPKSEAETAQMTIFYAGQVIVFDNFPAEKANEIMMLAGKSSAPAQNHHAAAFPPPNPVQSSATSISKIVPAFSMSDRPHVPSPQTPLGSDLPIARKNSLARFLEKRKDRITANAPYQVKKVEVSAAASKPAKAEGWLGLAPQFPLQIQRH